MFCGSSTIHVVKGVGCMIFQLELGGFVELDEVLFVPELLVNFLIVSTLEVDGCGVVFFHRHWFLYLEGLTPNTFVFIDVHYEILYRLLG